VPSYNDLATPAMPDISDIVDLEKYRIPGLKDAYYIPNFISSAEEDYLVEKINQSPKPRWKTVPTGRR
jgi:alkylated DNA repair protein alkB family protein 6